MWDETQFLRAEADRCRKKAEETSDEKRKACWVAVANTWRDLADAAAKRHHGDPVPAWLINDLEAAVAEAL